MGAQLTRYLLGLCAGHGRLALRGCNTNRRPMLTMRRLEDQKTYLDHQLRSLRTLHDGPLKVVSDRQEGQGYYDMLRFRCSSEQFQRAYELLYPRDQRCWSLGVIQLAGDSALAALWLDHGRWVSMSGGVISPPWSSAELLEWMEILRQRKVRCSTKVSPATGELQGIVVGASGSEVLMGLIRPHVHRSMRERLRPRKMLGRAAPLA